MKNEKVFGEENFYHFFFAESVRKKNISKLTEMKSYKKAFIRRAQITHQTVPKSFKCDTLQLVDSSPST